MTPTPALNRRRFAQTLVGATAVSALPLSSWAQSGLKEGTDYLKLERPAPTDAPKGKVEVLEFFWYNCPHCFQFEPTFDAWSKKQNANVIVRRIPVAFRETFVPQQQLYYALETMGLVDTLHRKVFNTIHVDKQRLETPAAILDWVGKQGVDVKAFEAAFKSFGVMGKAKRAAQLQASYQVDGVPSLGIASQYYTSGSLAGTLERSLQVADQLIAKSL